MSLLPKTLGILSKRSIEWTGLLQRVFREFAEAAEVSLTETETDNLYAIPDRLVDLAQSGVLQTVEIEAGRDGLSISLSTDPNTQDDLDLSMLQLCDLAGSQVLVCLVVNDTRMATRFGVEHFVHLSSANLRISLRSTESQEVWAELPEVPSGNFPD